MYLQNHILYYIRIIVYYLNHCRKFEFMFIHSNDQRTKFCLRVSRSPITKCLWSSPRPISDSQLHALPHFHLCPIYLVVFKGSYSFRWDISS